MTPVLRSAVVAARSSHGRLVRIPYENHWAPATVLTHGVDGAPRYQWITIKALVDRGIAVFTKFGTRKRHGRLIPTEIELLENPVIDPDTGHPTLPAQMLEAERAWREARKHTRRVAELLRVMYPCHALVPFTRDATDGTRMTARVVKHDVRNAAVHVQTASGRLVSVPHDLIMRAVVGSSPEEEPALDSGGQAVL